MQNKQRSVPKQAGDTKPRDRKNSYSSKPSNPGTSPYSYNFTVAVRVKPLLPSVSSSSAESQSQPSIACSTPDNKTLILEYPEGHTHSYSASRFRKYNFDRIHIDTTNRNLYQQLIRPKLQILKEGLNLTILTYGITGSGKTHTIFGKREIGEEGIVMMCFEDVMKMLGEGGEEGEMEFQFSFMQIYNQLVQDLLQPDSILASDSTTHCQAQPHQPPKLKSLPVLQDSKGKLNIPQLSRTKISSLSQLHTLIQKGNTIRACSSNLVNKLSSRSHALMQLYCVSRRTRVERIVTVIDLAGSQRCSVGRDRERERENSINRERENRSLQKQGSNINKSLLALGSCIKGLQTGQTHIPYRDSKLTRILKDDLSGRAHNIMIACISHSLAQSEQTINTLNYAARATQIRVEKQVNSGGDGNYQCSYCFRLVPWGKIVKIMPEEYRDKGKATDQCKNGGQQKQMSIERLFNKNTNQVYQNYLQEHLSQLKQNILSLISISQPESPKICNLLFPSKSNINYKSSNDKNSISNNNTHRDIVELAINDMFNQCMEKLVEKLGKSQGNGKEMRSQSIGREKFYQTCKLRPQATTKQSDTQMTATNPKNPIQATQNIHQSDTYRTIQTTSMSIMSNLRKQFSLQDRDLLQLEQNGKNGYSKYGGINQTYATLSDLSNLYSENVGTRRTSVRRMKPDMQGGVEGDGWPTNNKKKIIDKILEAKRKAYNSQYELQPQQNTNPIDYIHQNQAQFEYEYQYEISQDQDRTKPRTRTQSQKPVLLRKRTDSVKKESSGNCNYELQDVYVSSFVEEDSGEIQRFSLC